jgi:superfamily II DNA helicase RecQ
VAADPSEAALTEVARCVFGFAGFRGLQLPVIQRVLAGQSTLAIMPTGALHSGTECRLVSCA